jgi:hypothetical protein
MDCRARGQQARRAESGSKPARERSEGLPHSERTRHRVIGRTEIASMDSLRPCEGENCGRTKPVDP